MKIVRDAAAFASEVGSWRAAGERVAFVPTMGALHAGHLALVDLARRHATRAVASIFVNPSQFAPHEDLDRYPRREEADARLLRERGCDLLFAPERETIYPEGFASWIEPGGAALGLEGAFRPHFFRGVATVVARLFGLVRPDLAVFGEKDAQQLAVVRQLVRDLALPVEIVAGPTVREPDGLALSSRNAYLSDEERRVAPALFRALQAGEALFTAGERDAAAIVRAVEGELAREPRFAVQYVALVEATSFQPVSSIEREAVLALAAMLGGTRLIDNVRLTPVEFPAR